MDDEKEVVGHLKVQLLSPKLGKVDLGADISKGKQCYQRKNKPHYRVMSHARKGLHRLVRARKSRVMKV